MRHSGEPRRSRLGEKARRESVLWWSGRRPGRKLQALSLTPVLFIRQLGGDLQLTLRGFLLTGLRQGEAVIVVRGLIFGRGGNGCLKGLHCLVVMLQAEGGNAQGGQGATVLGIVFESLPT